MEIAELEKQKLIAEAKKHYAVIRELQARLEKEPILKTEIAGNYEAIASIYRKLDNLR